MIKFPDETLLSEPSYDIECLAIDHRTKEPDLVHCEIIERPREDMKPGYIDSVKIIGVRNKRNFFSVDYSAKIVIQNVYNVEY